MINFLPPVVIKFASLNYYKERFTGIKIVIFLMR